MDTLFGFLSPFQWVILIGGIAAFGIINGWPLVTALRRMKLPASVAAVADDATDDALDLQAFSRIRARFERLGCKEGLDLIDKAGAHFLHRKGDA